MKYTISALDQKGVEQNITVDASSEKEAIAIARTNGLKPFQVELRQTRTAGQRAKRKSVTRLKGFLKTTGLLTLCFISYQTIVYINSDRTVSVKAKQNSPLFSKQKNFLESNEFTSREINVSEKNAPLGISYHQALRGLESLFLMKQVAASNGMPRYSGLAKNGRSLLETIGGKSNISEANFIVSLNNKDPKTIVSNITLQVTLQITFLKNIMPEWTNGEAWYLAAVDRIYLKKETEIETVVRGNTKFTLKPLRNMGMLSLNIKHAGLNMDELIKILGESLKDSIAHEYLCRDVLKTEAFYQQAKTDAEDTIALYINNRGVAINAVGKIINKIEAKYPNPSATRREVAKENMKISHDIDWGKGCRNGTKDSREKIKLLKTELGLI